MNSNPEADTFDTIDGVPVVYLAAQPDIKYEVVDLLDGEGNPTEDEDNAAGGVVKIREGCFKVFTFPGHPAIPTQH